MRSVVGASIISAIMVDIYLSLAAMGLVGTWKNPAGFAAAVGHILM